MKNRIITSTKRAVKNSFMRFLSLLLMSMLGVFVFAGLKATSPDMIKTLDRYLDKYDTYDLRIVSDMGLTNDSIDILRKIKSIKSIEGGYSKDILVKNEKSESVMKVSSLPQSINRLELVSGRLPQRRDEIVVEENYIKKAPAALGDSIDLGDGFNEKKATIVGTVSSALYFNNSDLSQDRGTTNVGTGTVNYYAYIPREAFDGDIFTYVYLTVDGAKETITSSKEYLSVLDDAKNQLESIKEELQNERYNEIYQKANSEIEKSEKELNDRVREAKIDLEKAKEEIEKAENELKDAEKTLIQSEKELKDTKNKLDSAKEKINTSLSAAGLTEEEINKTIQELTANVSEMKKMIASVPEIFPQYSELKQKLDFAEQNLTKLITLKSGIDELHLGEKQYEDGLKKYQNGKDTYEKNMRLFQDSKSEYLSSLEKLTTEEEKGREEISDAKEELNKVKRPTVYYYDRTDGGSYQDYIDDSGSIENLSKIFPVVFFAVAVLVSLISMNRMVEEERGEIGTLKSLGFSSLQIMTKYSFFSLFATVLGGIVGAALGLVILPSMIFGIYGILFDVPDLSLGLNIGSTLLGFLITVICVCGSSIYTALKELRSKPSDLMRPKAPKSGKRVLLERVDFIWKRLNFSKKVIVRNLFRYKKRVIVTVVGIAGCTALILCGFGIRDSITDIPSRQFNDIFKFDATIYTNNSDKIASSLENAEIESCFYTVQKPTTSSGVDCTLFVSKNKNELQETVNLTDIKSQQIISLEENKAIITEKLSELTGLKIGDEIQLTDTENKSYKFKISGIAVNYVGHYIFVDEDTFLSEGGAFSPNVVYLKLSQNANENDISKELLKDENIFSVSFKSKMINGVGDMLKSLDSVVAILIVLAALLAFVVLYNLSNININERKREIATLKVLGFNDREVDGYVTKEMLILTALGLIIGLVIGFFLTNAVVATVEIERCRFIHNIKPLSYVYSSALSILFTLLINFVTHFKLQKINMTESLKSIE